MTDLKATDASMFWCREWTSCIDCNDSSWWHNGKIFISVSLDVNTDIEHHTNTINSSRGESKAKTRGLGATCGLWVETKARQSVLGEAQCNLAPAAQAHFSVPLTSTRRFFQAHGTDEHWLILIFPLGFAETCFETKIAGVYTDLRR